MSLSNLICVTALLLNEAQAEKSKYGQKAKGKCPFGFGSDKPDKAALVQNPDDLQNGIAL